MDRVSIDAWVCEILANRLGDRSEKARVSATYESAGIVGSITFDVPISEAKDFYVGQLIKIYIEKGA